MFATLFFALPIFSQEAKGANAYVLELANIALPLDAGIPDGSGTPLIFAAVLGTLPKNLQAAVTDVQVLHRSVDARKKRDVHFVATLGVTFRDDAAQQQALAWLTEHRKQVKIHTPYTPLEMPDCSVLAARDEFVRPIVVGTGPAGLFAALYLARCGVRPIVLERGADIDRRVEVVESCIASQTLNPLTNIQFGEGGAGTFSDGKLTTNIKSPFAPHVLHWFVEAGAPQDILLVAKPHIGTDVLRRVVRTLRDEIVALGGEVRFETQLTGFRKENNRLCAVQVQTHDGSKQEIFARQVVLACGHSARDTFAVLDAAGIALEQKPFSMGVRIEHEQKAINQAQYGSFAAHPALGAADYKMAVHLENGRSAYTFCMCPGGSVVCAASEERALVVNGMSNRARDGRFANSALLVGVNPADFGGESPLAGVEFQRKWERAAFELALAAGGAPYQAPAQSVASFLASGSASLQQAPQPAAQSSSQLVHQSANLDSPQLVAQGVTQSAMQSSVQSSAQSSVQQSSSPTSQLQTSYERGVVACDLHACLPDFVAQTLEEALPLLDRKLAGFADGAATMIGVETRSSSPVRIVRNDDLQSVTCEGLYPCGEGAGYAGGIMSAASDGLRVASQLVSDMQQCYFAR